MKKSPALTHQYDMQIILESSDIQSIERTTYHGQQGSGTQNLSDDTFDCGGTFGCWGSFGCLGSFACRA